MDTGKHIISYLSSTSDEAMVFIMNLPLRYRCRFCPATFDTPVTNRLEFVVVSCPRCKKQYIFYRTWGLVLRLNLYHEKWRQENRP
jgi:hypothetical protein